MYIKDQIILTSLILFASINAVGAQPSGAWGISVGAAYVSPVAGLADWFKPTYGFELAVGEQQEDGWYFKGCVDYVRFYKKNLQGTAAQKVDLNLEHIGFLFNAGYTITEWGSIKPYLAFGVGPHYYKGTRGQIEADPDRGIPLIVARTNEEWNWGFTAGVGARFLLIDNLALDLQFKYRFVVGDLWPTLQQYIELEGVSGLQTLNIAGGLEYYFH